MFVDDIEMNRSGFSFFFDDVEVGKADGDTND